MKYTLSSFLISLLLICSCNRQGPMGPEGPQGPDGPPGAGTGAGNMTSFIKSAEDEFNWMREDGWGGYGVYTLNDGDDLVSIELPPSLNDAVEKGVVLVYYLSQDERWHRLPFVYGENLDEIYDFVLDRGTGYKVILRAKARLTGERVHHVLPQRIKVVVAGASDYIAIKVGR